MRAIARFFVRMWYVNRNVELRRQLRALERVVEKVRPWWSHLTPEARQQAVGKSGALRALLRAYRMGDELFGDGDIR